MRDDGHASDNGPYPLVQKSIAFCCARGFRLDHSASIEYTQARVDGAVNQETRWRFGGVGFLLFIIHVDIEC